MFSYCTVLRRSDEDVQLVSDAAAETIDLTLAEEEAAVEGRRRKRSKVLVIGTPSVPRTRTRTFERARTHAHAHTRSYTRQYGKSSSESVVNGLASLYVRIRAWPSHGLQTPTVRTFSVFVRRYDTPVVVAVVCLWSCRRLRAEQ